MKKYAISITATKGYVPGLNAVLNGLEYHKNNIDVYVWTDSHFLPQSYTEQFPNVHFGLIDPSFTELDRPIKWHCRFFNVYKVAEMLKSGVHAVILLWDADALVLANYEQLFEMSEKAGKIIMSFNEMTCPTMEEMPKQWPYPKRTTGRYSSVPLFVPAVHAAYLDLILSYQERGGKFGIWVCNNYAVRDYGEEHVFALAGEQWIQSSHYWKVREVRKGSLQLALHSSTPMYSAHKKFWSPAAVLRKSKSPIATHNIAIFHKLWNFFNEECRVKLSAATKD